MSQKGLPVREAGAIALTIPLLLIIGVVLFLLVSQGIIKNPLKPSSKEASAPLQTTYQNPFDKSSQYVNPFSSYQNPFDSLK